MEEPAATKVEFVEPTKAEECAPPAVAPTPSKNVWRRATLVTVALALLTVLITTAITVAQLSDLPLKVRTAEVDLRNEKRLQMAVDFEVQSPALVVHSLSVDDITCELALMDADTPQPFGVLKSDGGIGVTSGTQRCSTRLVDANVTLLATLLSGRISSPEVVMDCKSNVRLMAWHLIPINRRLSSKLVFGGATTDDEDDHDNDELRTWNSTVTDDTSDKASDKASDKDKLWSARLVSSKPRMERVDGIVMRNDVEVTFDHRHGMAMLLTNLKTHTDAFSVQLPELKLAVSMNVSAGPAASNATADAPPQPERAADAPPRAGHVERGGDLQVHDLQVGTSATVTQEHVTVEDSSGDVKLTLRLEVDVRCPNLMCAPGVLQFLADDPFTWSYPGKAKDPLETPASRKLLNNDYDYYYSWWNNYGPWNYDTYNGYADWRWIREVGFGGTMFGQLTVTVDDDYYLGASVLLGDYDLEGGIELGTKLDYFTFDLTPEYYSQSNTWWNNYDNWGAWLWDTLDKLPGLIDGLPGDHTTWGWWNAFDSVSATVVRVNGLDLWAKLADNVRFSYYSYYGDYIDDFGGETHQADQFDIIVGALENSWPSQDAVYFIDMLGKSTLLSDVMDEDVQFTAAASGTTAPIDEWQRTAVGMHSDRDCLLAAARAGQTPAQVAQSCRAGNYVFATQQGLLFEEGANKPLQLEMDLLGKYGKADGTYTLSKTQWEEQYDLLATGTWVGTPNGQAEAMGIIGTYDARSSDAISVQGTMDLGDEAYQVLITGSKTSVPKVEMNIEEICNTYERSYYAYNSNYDYGIGEYRYGMYTRCWSEDFFETTYAISGTVRAPVDTMEFTASAAGLGSKYFSTSSLQQDGDWQPAYSYDYDNMYDYSYSALQGSTDTVHAHVLWETTGESAPTLKLELDLEDLVAGLGSANGRMALALARDKYTASARVDTLEAGVDMEAAFTLEHGESEMRMKLKVDDTPFVDMKMGLTLDGGSTVLDTQAELQDTRLAVSASMRTEDDACYLNMDVCGRVETDPLTLVDAHVQVSGADLQANGMVKMQEMTSASGDAQVMFGQAELSFVNQITEVLGISVPDDAIGSDTMRVQMAMDSSTTDDLYMRMETSDDVSQQGSLADLIYLNRLVGMFRTTFPTDIWGSAFFDSCTPSGECLPAAPVWWAPPSTIVASDMPSPPADQDAASPLTGVTTLIMLLSVLAGATLFA